MCCLTLPLGDGDADTLIDSERLLATAKDLRKRSDALRERGVDAEDESEIASQFLARYPGSPKDKWAAYGRVLMSSNEFMYID